jgi:hypothetical protein
MSFIVNHMQNGKIGLAQNNAWLSQVRNINSVCTVDYLTSFGLTAVLFCFSTWRPCSIDCSTVVYRRGEGKLDVRD